MTTVAQTLFQSNLTDLIKGIRRNKKTEKQFISHALLEMKVECKATDGEVKSTAVQKLTFV